MISCFLFIICYNVIGDTMILEVINQCSSPVLGVVLSAFKKMLGLIQIIVPILLIIASSINLIRLVHDPEDKKRKKKVLNSIIAAVLVFFIPMLVNAVMAMVDNSYDLSACWNETVEPNFKVTEFINPQEGMKKKGIILDPSDYEKGNPKPANNNSNNNGSNNNNGNNNNNNGQNDGNVNLPSNPGDVSGLLQVHFINPNSRVDAIYIKAGNQSIFVDGGFKSDSKREIAYLDKIGVTHIDYYIASHSHTNHVEAAPPIIQKYGIKKVLDGRETCSGSGSTHCSWYAIQGFAKKQGISLSGVSERALVPGDVFYLGGLKITCLGPIDITNGLSPTVTKQNYNSLILRLDYGSTSFLLTGDNSSSSNMKRINSVSPGSLNVDVLKNAHHNGCNSSTYQMANAEYIVFTTRYDYLPSAQCINTIKRYGAKYYFIAANNHDGNILFTSDGNNIKAYPHYKD